MVVEIQELAEQMLADYDSRTPGRCALEPVSLSTSEVFTTRDAPHFYLTFRRVPRLDFRVYKVRDPFAFFAGLDDPHQYSKSSVLIAVFVAGITVTNLMQTIIAEACLWKGKGNWRFVFRRLSGGRGIVRWRATESAAA